MCVSGLAAKAIGQLAEVFGSVCGAPEFAASEPLSHRLTFVNSYRPRNTLPVHFNEFDLKLHTLLPHRLYI